MKEQVRAATCVAVLASVSILGPFSGCGSSSSSDGSSSGTKETIEVARAIDVTKLQFDGTNLRLFESSNYMPGVRTDKGFALYATEFRQHNVVRVNAFDWAAVSTSSCRPTPTVVNGQPGFDYSACVAQFKHALEQSAGYLDVLTRANSTRILMVDLFRTPTWLSRSTDTRAACGGGVLAQAYRPVDYQVWRQLLDVAVQFFRRYDGAKGTNSTIETQIYYQFWNEPDLACNWQEGTAELLELYQQTMPYVKQAHPTAKVGGPGSQAWAGRVTKDGSSRAQNLAFDLIDFARTNSLPLEFLTWHYFSNRYRAELLDGVQAYRDLLASRAIAEANLPLIINEWLPQSETPNGLHRYVAPDAANAFLAFHQGKVFAQGGIPWQDYGDKKTDEWGIISYNLNGSENGLPDATKKPIFYVYEFFDQLSRTSQGISYWTDDIAVAVNSSTQPFKVGERKFLVSRETQAGCYRLSTWNRLVPAEEGSIAYLFGQGVTLQELAQAYGSDPTVMLSNLTAAIKTASPLAPNWANAFAGAKSVYESISKLRDHTEYAYVLDLASFGDVESSQSKTIGRDGVFIQDKAIRQKDSIVSFSLQMEEVMYVSFCPR